MDELTYFECLAAEVIRSEDPRLKKLLAWVDDIHIAIKACSDKPTLRPRLSAVTASGVLMKVVLAEETKEAGPPEIFMAPYNKRDVELVSYSVKVLEETKEIEVSATITDVFGIVGTGNYTFAPIKIPFSRDPESENA